MAINTRPVIRWTRTSALVLTLAAGSLAFAQPPADPDGMPPMMPGGGGMMRGPGGPMGQERKLVKQFDADGDGRLNIAEREAARKSLKTEKAGRPNRMGGGPGGMGGGDEPVKPGPTVSPSEVAPAAGDLYDPKVMRTIFLDFDASDWEEELEDFYNTDVEVPATMTVDGKKYPGVGVHFRGASSFFGVRAGHKRSLNVSMDFTNEDQTLKTQAPAGDKGKHAGEYRTLNLLNSHEDPSFMSSVLYSTIANQYIPAPRANYVRVVVNGESWGVYVNLEQFNKDFVKRNFHKAGEEKKAKGAGEVGGHEARWKVKGSPGARSGLEYTGDDAAVYKQKYQIKSSDNDGDWKDLINLCKVLNTTPPERLEAALKPILDVDATLKFLALDVVLANGDGYWTRASDYSIYKDAGGVFHIVPHDMNECFQPTLMMMPGGMMGGRGPRGPGPGGGGGGGSGDGRDGQSPGNRESGPDGAPRPPSDPREPALPNGEGRPSAAPDGAPGPRGMRGIGGRGGEAGGRGGQASAELDPLIGLGDATKPLRSKLLAVPSLRERYLGYVKQIAEKDLDWKTLGPIVAANRALIEKPLEADTRKLSSIAEFRKATADQAPAAAAGARREPMNLRTFADKRRAYLLGYAPKDPAKVETTKGNGG